MELQLWTLGALFVASAIWMLAAAWVVVADWWDARRRRRLLAVKVYILDVGYRDDHCVHGVYATLESAMAAYPPVTGWAARDPGHHTTPRRWSTQAGDSAEIWELDVSA
jgi:hypothetical protein